MRVTLLLLHRLTISLSHSPTTMPFRKFTSQARKIVAIGRNYADHAKELGNEVPKTPFFFLKPTSSFVTEPNAIEVPKGAVVHHEG